MVLTSYKLRVRDLSERDTYKDMIRVHWQQRDSHKNGSIVRVRVDGQPEPWILVIRGCEEKDKDTIAIDHLTREELRVKLGEEHNFTFEKTNWRDKVRWAAESADPAARVATWIALFFGVMAVGGLLVALIGLYPVVKEIRRDWNEPVVKTDTKAGPVAPTSEPGKR